MTSCEFNPLGFFLSLDNKGQIKCLVVLPVYQLLHSLGKMLFILNTLNPICIYVNLLNALLQGSSNLGFGTVCKKLLYFFGLLKRSKLRHR